MNEGLAYLLKRTLSLLIAVYLIANAIFVLMFIVPGDPAWILVPTTGDFELRQECIEDLKLDESLPAQYVNFMAKMFSGKFFVSVGVMKGANIHELVVDSLPFSFLLLVTTSLLSAALGIIVELPFRRRTGTILDRFYQLIMAFLFCIPAISLALTFMWVNIKADGSLPLFGNGTEDYLDDSGTLVSLVKHAFLPILCGVVASFGGFALLAHSSFLRKNALRGSIDGAMATGQPTERTIPPRIPSIASAKFFVPWVMTTVIVIDVIFGYHGIGNLFVQSIWYRDFPTLMVCAFILGVITAASAYTLDIMVLVEQQLRSGSRPSEKPRETVPAPLTKTQYPGGGLDSCLREFVGSKTGVLALILVCLFLATAAAAPLVSTVSDPMHSDRYEPTLMSGDPRLLPGHDEWRNPLPPSLDESPYTGLLHPLGTDYFGRDIYSMLVYGARDGVYTVMLIAGISLLAGFVVWIFASALAGQRDVFAKLVEFGGLAVAESVIAMPLVVVGALILATLGHDWSLARLSLAIAMFAFALPIFYFRARVSGLGRTSTGAESMTRDMIAQWRKKNMFGGRMWIEVLHTAKFTTVVGFFSVLSLQFIGLMDPSVISWGGMIEAAFDFNAVMGGWWMFIPAGVAAMVLPASVYLIMDTFERILTRKAVLQ